MTRLSAALLLAFALRAASANSPSDYAYVFPIETPPPDATQASSAWRIELTPEVYRWVQDAGLRDLEIFNAEQRPVPFARIAVDPVATTREQSTPLPVLELPASAKKNPSDLRLVIDRDAQGHLRRIDAGEQSSASSTTTGDWLLDASGLDRAIDRLVLSWREPASGIVARFAIDTSDDLQSWRSAGTATVLVLEQQGAHLERREIPLAGARAKYLRLHRLDDGAAIVGLRAEARSVEHAHALPERAWIAAEAKPTAGEAAPAGITRFDYALGAALPVETARIELVSDNALAPVSLFARASDAASAPWIRVGGLTAFRLRQGDETLHNDDIDVRDAQRLRAFRIESATMIAETPRLALGYRPDSLTFLAEGSGPYVLAAGSAHARHADYPIEPALASLRASLGKDWQPPVAKLGSARASGGDAALSVPAPPVPWRRWLLWGVLIAGALVVAGLALSLLRGSKGVN